MEQKTTIPQDAVAALHRGNKIEAIKLVREAQGIGLKEAKDLVEQFLRTDQAVQASFAQMRAQSGGSSLRWWVIVIGIAALVLYFWRRFG
jgi:CHASE3 domain sensor protein